uniref:Secreted protein n=1 Tax=Streptomyces sp. NBC_00008 TaxID=2903610 RepID=A0AAU2VT62_9ACTN
MSASGVSAASIAARLSAVGLPTRMEEHTRFTTVEAEVPETLSAESWREVLGVVADADRFGLLATSLNGRTLWAAVRKTVPTTGEVGEPGYQR